MTKEEEQQGFRVTDKRGFREDGETRTPESPEKPEEKPSSDSASSAGRPPSDKEVPPRPPMDFQSYVLSCYTQALVLLGEVPNLKKEEDVEAAQYMIEILSLLEQKTKGNLDKQEEQVLENVLYELRMKYMAKTNRIKY